MRGCRAIIKRLPIIELSHSQHPGMARTSSVTCGQCSRRNPRVCRCRVVAVVVGVVGGGSRGSSSSTSMPSAPRWTLCARSALRSCGLTTTWSASTSTARALTFWLMPRIGCTSTTPTANQPVKSGLLVAPPLGIPVSYDEPVELLCALEEGLSRPGLHNGLQCRQRTPRLELSLFQHPGLLEILAPSFAQMAR